MVIAEDEVTLIFGMSEGFWQFVVGAILVFLGTLVGHWFARRNAQEQNKTLLVAEINDTKIETKKLDFDILKSTVETLKTEVERLSDKVKELDERLNLISSKYWRLINVVRGWVTRYHISEEEIPHDIREDL